MNADQISFDDLAIPREIEEDEDDTVNSDATPPANSGLTGIWSFLASASSTAATTSTTGSGTTGSTTVNVTPYGTTSKIYISGGPHDDAFNLKDMGITTVGTFDSSGQPVNWQMHFNPLDLHYPAFMHHEPVMKLDPSPEYRVYIRGIYSKKYTNERRAAIGLQPI